MINNFYRRSAVVISTYNLPPKFPMPGTFGAFQACVPIWALHTFGNIAIYSIWAPLLMFVIALPIIHEALKHFQSPDPALICLDEVVGMWVTLCMVQLSWFSILLGFALFRFFDIVKPLGIKRIEQLPGAFGVLLDDVAAGLLANIFLQFILCTVKFGS